MAQAVRHDAKFSDQVLDVLRGMLLGPGALPGPIVDPFAGAFRLGEIDRPDLHGIELEPEWAAVDDRVVCGSALDRVCYPVGTQTVVTSPCYGNRMADTYLGPKCASCRGDGVTTGGLIDQTLRVCPKCGGVGRDGRGRFSYTLSLGRRPSEGSAAVLQWGIKYRAFHLQWLNVIAGVLPVGERRLVLNMSDHVRAKTRVHVCSWWVSAAHDAGFRLVESWPADTARIGFGQNHEQRAESEWVFVFDLLERKAG